MTYLEYKNKITLILGIEPSNEKFSPAMIKNKVLAKTILVDIPQDSSTFSLDEFVDMQEKGHIVTIASIPRLGATDVLIDNYRLEVESSIPGESLVVKLHWVASCDNFNASSKKELLAGNFIEKVIQNVKCFRVF